MDMFILNSDIHNIHTRHGSYLHNPIYKLAKVQKGVFHSGIKIFNNLPQNVTNLSSDAYKFKYALKKLLRVRFEVFTAVTMKIGVFWDVTPCGVTSQKTQFFKLLHIGSFYYLGGYFDWITREDLGSYKLYILDFTYYVW
jgi:hypothetical protein